MRFEAAQHMKMGQQMKLAPRMIQSMEILQMPLAALEERISQELESNATLELVEPSGDGSAEAEGRERFDGADARANDRTPEADAGGDSGGDDFARLDAFESDVPEAAEYESAVGVDHDRAAERMRELIERDRAGTSGRGRLDGEGDAKSEAMANTAARSASLSEQLREQWGLVEVDEPIRTLGQAIIEYIEDDGYLRTPLETIADRLPAARVLSNGEAGASVNKPDPSQMERALTAVQLLLDPPGVGARDVKECLLLQVEAMSGDPTWGTPVERQRLPIVKRLIEDHLDDLAQNRLPKIAEKTGLSLDEVKAAMEQMRHLSLAPARALVEEQTGVIVPDAVVEYDADQDRYIAYLNDWRLPNLRVNQEYARLAKDKQAPQQTREFIKKNLSNAEWLIDAVQQRQRTLLRVLNAVVEAQRDYFDYGPQSLKPLPMTQVAERLGVHVATVSRAVADKYVMTPRGVVPLRGFFSGGTQTDTGEDMSWDAVKAALKEVIDAEDKAKPLSDDALAEALKARGIEIARRTVAKYRDQLNIPSARLRKQF